MGWPAGSFVVQMDAVAAYLELYTTFVCECMLSLCTGANTQPSKKPAYMGLWSLVISTLMRATLIGQRGRTKPCQTTEASAKLSCWAATLAMGA